MKGIKMGVKRCDIVDKTEDRKCIINVKEIYIGIMAFFKEKALIKNKKLF